MYSKINITRYVTPAAPGTSVIARETLRHPGGWQTEAWARQKALQVIAWLHEVALVDGEPICAVSPIGVHGLIDPRVFDGGALYFMPHGGVEWDKRSFPMYADTCF